MSINIDRMSRFSIPTLSYESPRTTLPPAPTMPTSAPLVTSAPSPTMPVYTPPIYKRKPSHTFSPEELGLKAYTAEEIDLMEETKLLEETRTKIKETRKKVKETSDKSEQTVNKDDLTEELLAFKEAFALQNLGDVQAWEVVDGLTEELISGAEINQIAAKMGVIRDLDKKM